MKTMAGGSGVKSMALTGGAWRGGRRRAKKAGGENAGGESGNVGDRQAAAMAKMAAISMAGERRNGINQYRKYDAAKKASKMKMSISK